MEDEGMELEIIVNPKTTDDGQQVIQVNLLPISTNLSVFSPITHSLRQQRELPSNTLKVRYVGSCSKDVNVSRTCDLFSFSSTWNQRT
jgi:hypothetical protein